MGDVDLTVVEAASVCGVGVALASKGLGDLLGFEGHCRYYDPETRGNSSSTKWEHFLVP